MESMKEYTLILDDEELEELLQVLRDDRGEEFLGMRQMRNVHGVIQQLEILKAKNTEDYE